MLKLNLIVAACENMGIGVNGGLPWTLKNEMKHFARMTKKVSDAKKRNVIIMGRRTWEEIKRPLPERINVVLTRSLPASDFPDNVIVCQDFQEALQKIQEPELAAQIENVWIVGGFSVYKEAMESEHCHRIYFTKILSTFDCDAFFPAITSSFKQVANDEGIPTEVQEENGIKYQYQIFEKIH